MTATPKERLVTREMLEGLIDGVKELGGYEKFLKLRWVGMVMWWHQRSVDARWKYFLLRFIVVVGGVTIPVLSALNLVHPGRALIPAAIAIVGALVGASAAWEGVAGYGNTWLEKRRAAELLKCEGWQFVQRCGKYKTEGSGYASTFPIFASEVESMIAKEVGEYLGGFDKSVQQATTMALDELEQIKKLVLQLQQAKT